METDILGDVAVINPGDKIYYWTVLRLYNKGSYLCRCQCGEERVIKRSVLIKGGTKSCGCMYHVKDLRGQTFGELTPLKYIGNKKWLCKCSCSKEVEVDSYKLSHGMVTSCGHSGIKGKTKDLRGMQFGYLTPIEYKGGSVWLCKCSCGNPNCLGEKEIAAYSLVSGATKSCGAGTTNFKSLVGKKFGAWTVIKYADKNKQWLCRCECGVEKVVDLKVLQFAPDHCTHEPKLIDITGQRFGKLIAKRHIGDSIWECQCDCGKTINVYSSNLRRAIRGTRSCGCSTEELRQNTMIDKYGDIAVGRINNPREVWQIEGLRNKEGLLKVIDQLTNKLNRKPTLSELSDYLDCDYTRIAEKLKRYNIRDTLNNTAGTSSEELKIQDFIKEICENEGYTLKIHSRILPDGKELDMYIPEIKLGIEYNGSFWHSTLFKDRKYHLNKSIACAKMGIRLIHIFDYEIWNNFDRIKMYLNDIISKNKVIVQARLCTIKEVDTETTREFLNKYHIQGYAISKINIALYYKSEIIGIMTFGSPRFSNTEEFELIRLCWKSGIIVNGGSEKLFSYFIKVYNPNSIVSYCDVSKFTGKVYYKLGFKFDKLTDPGYMWVSTRDKKYVPRYQTSKQKLIEIGIGSSNETEDEIMESLNYYKVYNCGNNRYIWKRD